MEASARPMAAFSLAVTAPAGGAGEDVSFMMNLPTAIEPDMHGAVLSFPSHAWHPSACHVRTVHGTDMHVTVA